MPPAAPTAFFSYSREDSEFVLRVAGDLKAAGANVWLDQMDIVPGQRWDEAIERALAGCPRMLVVLSPTSVRSTNVMDEVSFALEEGKTVIPILYRDCVIPFRLRRVQYIDLRHDYDHGLTELLKLLAEQQSTVANPGAAAPVARPYPGPLVDRLVPKPRVVDAAIPGHVVKALGTRLLVLIRLPDSPGLRGVLQMEEDEAHPEDVRSRPFNITFPLGPTGKPDPLKVTVKLTSPDFSPPEQAKNIFVPPDADSDVCPFMLTPKQIGRLTVLVELHWQDAIRGHRSLATKCVAEATDVPIQPEMNLVQMHVPVDIDALSQPMPSLATAAEPLPSIGRAPTQEHYSPAPLNKLAFVVIIVATAVALFVWAIIK